jgi:hypothetical protein
MTAVGFLTMLVFGVGYQLLPRLFGHPLYSPRLAGAHLVLANAGLAGLVLGFLVAPQSRSPGMWLLAGGGSLFGLGALEPCQLGRGPLGHCGMRIEAEFRRLSVPCSVFPEFAES